MDKHSMQSSVSDILRSRIEMTVSCRDSDPIPKVPNAGSIVHENGRRVQIMHNGVRVKAGGYYGDWQAEIIERLKGHHEPQEELVFYEILKRVPPTATMLELGGFWSFYSLWFLNEAAESRRSIVVEPDPQNMDVGKTNADINGRRIEFVQASVGEVSTEPQLFGAEASGPILVPQICVPDLLADRGIEHLDILHCDTQGAETAVIRSCETLLREKKIRFVFISTHAHQISGDPLTHQRCLAMLQDFGGRILAEHDVHESFSGDGLIAAYFGTEPIDWPKLNLTYNRYSTSLFPNPLYDLQETQTQLQEAHARFQALEASSQQHEQLLSQKILERDERINFLEMEVTALRDRLTAMEIDADEAKSARIDAAARIDALLASTSWRITAPLRAFAIALRRFRSL
ncbi:FkbM family methyltransferase [Microvirga sp. 2MCAF35]|uniref:FkbM family methyltransferase n=1 Tax=Microvirga sp. 2MCAF35 TaxID=3232987 RepID=UPI003F981EF0